MSDSIHANPVEITKKKDIYIIKNDINSKVYIGQSSNTALRFKQHCKKSNLDNSVVGKAIKKYGKTHFWYEIIESQISNYDERETYWISRYDSVVPNGYNVLCGGEQPPVLLGDEHPNTKISEEFVKLLKEDLKNTKIPLSDLSTKYGISKRQVLRINQGVSRFEDNDKYPIREESNTNGKLTEDDIDMIIELLRYTYIFNGEIARRFGVEVHAISDINFGQSHKRNNICYPIRDWKSSGKILFSYEQVTQIIDMLQHTDLSLNKIAKIFNVNVQPIQQINSGSAKKYRRDEIVYPIRRF